MYRKRYFGKLLAIFVAGCLLLSAGVSAQAGKPTPKPSPTAKVMPDTLKTPQFTGRFGPYNGKLDALPDDLKKLITTELIVTDQRGQKWEIVAWRFIWKRKEINDDWKTGKRQVVTTPSIVELDSTARLPASWQNELKEFLQSGEELIFERIIIEHPASKRKMMAPDFSIKIK